MHDNILDVSISRDDVLELNGDGRRVASILNHAGKWGKKGTSARPVGVAPRMPMMVSVQFSGAPEAEIWHRSFFRIAGRA